MVNWTNRSSMLYPLYADRSRDTGKGCYRNRFSDQIASNALTQTQTSISAQIACLNQTSPVGKL